MPEYPAAENAATTALDDLAELVVGLSEEAHGDPSEWAQVRDEIKASFECLGEAIAWVFIADSIDPPSGP